MDRKEKATIMYTFVVEMRFFFIPRGNILWIGLGAIISLKYSFRCKWNNYIGVGHIANLEKISMWCLGLIQEYIYIFLVKNKLLQ